MVSLFCNILDIYKNKIQLTAIIKVHDSEIYCLINGHFIFLFKG